MSHKATTWAFELTGLAPSSKLVLLALADRHNGDTGRCYPSIQKIANDCGVSVSSVHRHLTKLEEMEVIRRVGRFDGKGGRTSNEYELLMDLPRLENAVKSEERPPCQNDRTPLSNCDTPPVKLTYPPLSNCDSNQEDINQEVNQSKKYNKKIWFDRFWQVYPKKTGKIEAERKFIAALKHASAEHIIEGAERFARSVRNTEKQFIAHPGTWLHHGRWADEELSPVDAEKNTWDVVKGRLGIGS